MLRTVAVLAALVVVARATDFVFNSDKCHNLADVPVGSPTSGWRGNDPLGVLEANSVEAPRSVRFELPADLAAEAAEVGQTGYWDTNTFVPAGEWAVGSDGIIFADDGEVTFENGWSVTFYDDAVGEDAFWVAGQTVDENIRAGACDVTCTKNLFEVVTEYDPDQTLTAQVDSGALKAAESGVCNTDILWIPQGAFSIQAENTHLFFGGLRVFGNPDVITTKAELPERLFYNAPGDHSAAALDLIFGLEAVAYCDKHNILADGKCICENTCPASLADLLEADRVRQDAAREGAEADIEKTFVEYTDDGKIEVHFGAGGLGIPATDLACFFDYAGSDVFSGEPDEDPTALIVDGLETTMKDALEAQWGAPASVLIKDVTFSRETSVLKVFYELTAAQGSWFELDAQGDEVLIDTDPTVMTTSSPAFDNKLARIVITTFASLTRECTLSNFGCSAAQLDAATSDCGDDCGMGAIGRMIATWSTGGQAMANYNALSQYAEDLSAFEAFVPGSADPVGPPMPVVPTLALLAKFDGREQTVVDNFVAFAAANSASRRSLVETYLTLTDTCSATIEAVDVDYAAIPVLRTFSMPTMIVGHALSQLALNQIDNPLNLGAFRKHIADGISGVFGLVDVLEDSIALVKKPRFRRSAIENQAGAATELLHMTFVYTQFASPACVEGAGTPGCEVTAGSAEFSDLQDLVDDLTTTYVIAGPTCQDLTQLGQQPVGFDINCLNQQAQTAVDAALAQNPDLTPAEIEQIAFNTVFELTRCGVFGPDSTGACTESETEAAATSFAQSTATAQSDRVAASRSSSSSGGLPLPIIAGAIGGVVVIAALIAAFVLLRKDDDSVSSQKRKKSIAGADRTVVAFENPMYDDPGADPYADAAVYDQAAGEDEGLYDEPAFNADLAKANPMYTSAESLNNMDDDDMDDEDGGGYLDVAPDDDE